MGSTRSMPRMASDRATELPGLMTIRSVDPLALAC